MAIDPELLSVLACPMCRGGLGVMNETEGGEAKGLACEKCGIVYPVRDEIPVMLAEEAVPRREWEQGRREAACDAPRGT